MRIATALLLVVVLLALPACRMNERMSGAAFGGIGGAVVGGALGGSFAGGVVGGLAGGVLGYLVGDYLADKRERCSPPVRLRPGAPPPCAPPRTPPATVRPVRLDVAAGAAVRPAAPPVRAALRAAHQLRPGPRSARSAPANPNVVAARQAIEQGRRAATLPEARAAYEQAVRLDPQSADAWNALGLALGTGGDRAAADEAFRRALALDPHHYAARQNLGWAGSGTRPVALA